VSGGCGGHGGGPTLPPRSRTAVSGRGAGFAPDTMGWAEKVAFSAIPLIALGPLLAAVAWGAILGVRSLIGA
jgi:hypothetical protein